MIYNIINRMVLKSCFRYKIIKSHHEPDGTLNDDFFKYKV